MSDTLDMFASAVNDLANGPKISSFHELTEGLLRRLAEKGLTLEQCSDRKMMNRSIRTLKQHCRDYEISFPDYTPRAMKKAIKDGE